jgi:peptide/nickel transport system substrate-binding protein
MAPVGTGPYRVVRWLRGDRLELAANETYWAGRPAISRIDLRFVPDENSELVGLRSGELDGIIGLSANVAPQARALPHVRVVTTPVNAYWAIMMNTASGPTADVRVRRAIAAAADAAAFRRNVTHGSYRSAIADLPAVLWAADPSLRPIRHDAAHARELLAAAGYGPARRMPLEFAIYLGSQTVRAEAIALQSELRPLGIDAHVHGYLSDVFDAPPSQGGILSRGRYDIAAYGWFAGMDPDDSGQFTCAERPPAGYNHSFYCNAEMDAAQREALRTYDPTARRRAYSRIEALLLRDVPLAFLGSPVKVSALRDDLHGFAPSLTTQTANANRWTLSR